MFRTTVQSKRIGISIAVISSMLTSGARLTLAQATEAGVSARASTQTRMPASIDPHSSRIERRSPDGHHFWDNTNSWLFTGVAASRTLDYFSTLNMRRRGRQEILLSNDAVDNHAAFAAIEAAGTGVSIGASYLLHRSGHHKLERWVSIVHIGAATTGAVRNYCLQTFHTTSALNAP